jgi:uncharacterized membrane protein YfcA
VPAALLALLSGIVLVTSIIGVVTGGNSLVNVPAMIVCGMSPRVAVATNMFAVLFMTLAATIRFARERKVVTRLSLGLSAIVLVTSAIGAQLTVVLPEKAVKATIAVSMVVMLAFMLLRPRFGVVSETTTPLKRAIGWVASTILGVYGGLYSGGFTTLLTFVTVSAFGVALMDAVVLTTQVNLVSNIAASAVFLRGGVIDLRAAVPLCLSMLVGGWLGAHMALRKGERFVRVLFLSMIAVLAAKLLIYDLLIAR